MNATTMRAMSTNTIKTGASTPLDDVLLDALGIAVLLPVGANVSIDTVVKAGATEGDGFDGTIGVSVVVVGV